MDKQGRFSCIWYITHTFYYLPYKVPTNQTNQNRIYSASGQARLNNVIPPAFSILNNLRFYN